MRSDILNSKQLEAINTLDGPCMIVAGPGSGKTSVITHKIAHLVDLGVNPYNILAITFTNKAAKEIKARVDKLVNSDTSKLWMGTFHSIFLKLLKVNAHLINYKSDFSIYDTDDSVSLINSIIKDLALSADQYKGSVVYNRISLAKNKMITPLLYEQNLSMRDEDAKMSRPEIWIIYKRYCERCVTNNVMDFDDLLLNFYKIINQNADLLLKYQNLFKYILIDEFQDTNLLQYEIIKKLSFLHKNISVVGDDSQSIYAFRGADISNILNFQRDFPGLKIIKLEQNYRSTKSLVAAANSIISKNKNQIQKEIWTDNQEGDLIQIMRADSDIEEANMVSKFILESLKNNPGEKYSDSAVLYRTNTQSRAIEQSLRFSGIPYKIVGGLSFYQRKEVKDLVAYLKIISNPKDEESIKRVINVPRRGIGVLTLDKLIDTAHQNNISVWDVLKDASKYLEKNITRKIIDFVALIDGMIEASKELDLYELAKKVANESGLLTEIVNEKSEDSKARYENVQELLNSIKIYSDSTDNKDKGLADLLQEISLISSVDIANDENRDYVTLMTVHSSKGLEFKNLYVVGMEEDIFPSPMMLYSQNDLEEERRLFYVAVTRAKKKLYLLYALSRYRFGKIKNCTASRFIIEMNPICVHQSDKKNQQNKSLNRFGKSDTSLLNYNKEGSVSLSKSDSNMRVQESRGSSSLTVGMQVLHPKFSIGTIVSMDTSAVSPRVVVNFKQYGEKTLLVKFASLQIVSQH